MKHLLFFIVLVFLATSVSGQEASTITVTNVNNYTGFLYLTPESQTVYIPAESYIYQNITITQTGNFPITVHMNKTGAAADWVVFIENTTDYNNTNITLDALKSNETRIKIFVPFGNEGTHNVTVYAYSQDDSKYNYTNITYVVNDTNPIDDVTVVVVTPLIYQGNNLVANISITKISPASPVDVTIGYCLLLQTDITPCSMSIADETETKAVTTELNYVKTFTNVQNTPGEYDLKVIVEYKPSEDIPERAKATDQFIILEQGVTSTGGGVSGGGTSQLPPSEPEEPYEIEIVDLPSVLNLTSGMKKTIAVKVRNLELPVSNLSFLLNAMQSEWYEIEPDLIESVESGEDSIFLITFLVPRGLSNKNFMVNVLAITDQTSASKRMRIIITDPEELDDSDKLVQELENLWDVFDIVWSETTETGLQGFDVSDVFGLLAQARKSLNEAENGIETQEYDYASSKLGVARQLLEDAVNKIAVIEQIKLRGVPEDYITLVAVVVIILIILIAILSYKWASLKRATRVFRRSMELRKIKRKILDEK
ncbi:MAG: hypothetical protein ABIH52_01915 [Candidatus Aenigmatarchaeota archaeon]|nr:hypothetical protein [Nanoarchaeota archaeon]